MSDFLKDVAPGQPLQLAARTVNAWNHAARQARRERDAGAGAPGWDGAGGSLVVLIRNDTGGDLNARSVLSPGEPIVDATEYPHRVQELPAFEGTAPAADTDPFVVTLEPIADDAIGRAVLVGVAVVEISVSDSTHDFAEPAAGVTARLASADSGPARILWKQPGTGNKTAVVSLGGGGSSGGGGGTGSMVKGKLDGGLSFGGSATMSVWAFNGSAEADTGDNLLVYDWLLSSGQTVAAGTQVVAAFDDESDRYYVIGAQCA